MVCHRENERICKEIILQIGGNKTSCHLFNVSCETYWGYTPHIPPPLCHPHGDGDLKALFLGGTVLKIFQRKNFQLFRRPSIIFYLNDLEKKFWEKISTIQKPPPFYYF